MKKFLIILLIIPIFLIAGCLDNYVPVEDYENKISELEEAKNTIAIRDDNIADLEEEVESLEEDLDLTEEELKQYRNLIANLNEILKNIYYVYGSKSNGISSWGTGFSIKYKDRYYLITAGHCVENNYIGKMTNFKCKPNFSKQWIYPKLLAYEFDWDNRRDYAIFSSEKIENGLLASEDCSYNRYLYILGNTKLGINILKRNSIFEAGECGSPIVNLNREVVGIVTINSSRNYTPITTVIEAIDNLE